MLKEGVLWVFFALFWLALWKMTRPLRKEKGKQTKKSSSGKWYLPDTKSALMISAWLMLVAFPTVIMALWLSFWAMFLFVFVLGIGLYIGSKIVEGWSIKVEK